jgi:hypothetical protein
MQQHCVDAFRHLHGDHSDDFRQRARGKVEIRHFLPSACRPASMVENRRTSRVGPAMRRRDFILASVARIAWPFEARARQPARPVIGWFVELPQGSPVESVIPAFRRGIAELGYVEGKNFATEYRFGPESLPQAASDLVRLNVTTGSSNEWAVRCGAESVACQSQL